MTSQRRQQIKEAMTAMERVATFEKPNCTYRAACQQLKQMLQGEENKVIAGAYKTIERKLLSDGGE